jgi:hypothetical protein
LSSLVGVSEAVEKLAAEQVGQHANGEQVLLAAGDPAVAMRREATAGDDAVDVWMKPQIASPGVKHGRHAELGTEALLVVAELEQRAGRCREQEVEDRLPVLERERCDLVGQGEHDVEVVRGQHALHAFLDPRCLGEGLAFRTVSISAGVVRGPGERAPVADVDVPAELRGPADLDRAHRGPLRRREHMRLAVDLAVAAENVRNLDTRPPPPRRDRG